MNPATQPIFCLEEFELVNPPRNMQENYSTPYFYLRVKTQDEEFMAAAMLSDFVKACQAHAPAEARYIEQLHWYVANGGRSDFMLIQAMEDEGFEIERLMLIYLENEPWWKRLRREGIDKESMRLHAIEHPDSQLPEIAEMLFGFMVGPFIERTSAIAIAQAFQAELWKTFPEMENLHQKEVAQFIENTSKTADSFLTDDAADYEDFLETGVRALEVPYSEEFEFSLEGIQKSILEDRERYDKKPVNASAIELELLEIDYVWEFEPSNIVRFWYKATCQKGVFYDNVHFKYLVEEAALHFPEWYFKIEALREQIVALRPKEKQIVEALLAEHFDFIPLMTSYVNGWVDAQKCLDFEAGIRKYGNFKDRYDMHVKDTREWGPGLEHSRKIALFADRLEDLAFDMVCDLFPDMIKAAKPWMIKSLKRSAHLLVFQVMDDVWKLISLCEKKAG